MFGNLKDKLLEAQAEMKKKLGGIEIMGESAEGKIKVNVNGNRKVIAINIDPDLYSEKEVSEVENLIMEACNEALEEAEKVAEEEMVNSAKGALPNIPGLF